MPSVRVVAGAGVVRCTLACCLLVTLACPPGGSRAPAATVKFNGPTQTSDNLVADDGVPAPNVRATPAKNGELSEAATKGPAYSKFHGNGYQDGATLTTEIKAQPNPNPPPPPPPHGPGKASVNGSASKQFIVSGSGSLLLNVSLDVMLNEADAVSALPSTFTITGTLESGGRVLRTLTSTFTVSPSSTTDNVDVAHGGATTTYKANNVLDVQLDNPKDTITVGASATTQYIAKVAVVGAGQADGHTHTKVTATIHVKP